MSIAFRTRHATPDEAPWLKKQWTDYFGGDPREAGLVDAAMPDSPDTEFNHAYVALADGEPIGGLAGAMGPWEYLTSSIEYRDVWGAFEDGDAYLAIVFTEPGHRQNGVATSLTQRFLRTAREHGSTNVWALSWLRDGHADSSLLFDSMGWSLEAEVDQYYQQVCDREHCPDCGYPCSCDARIYRFGLTEEVRE